MSEADSADSRRPDPDAPAPQLEVEVDHGDERVASAEPPRVQFGRYLRSAREARGWSLEDCVEALHLPIYVLRYLEAGNYSHFDSGIYLRNYLQSYGEHVGIPAAQLTTAIQRLLPQADAAAAQVSSGAISHTASAHRSHATMLLLAILALVVVVSAVWLGVRQYAGQNGRVESLDAAPVGHALVQQELGQAAQTPETAEADTAPRVTDAFPLANASTAGDDDAGAAASPHDQPPSAAPQADRATGAAVPATPAAGAPGAGAGSLLAATPSLPIAPAAPAPATATEQESDAASGGEAAETTQADAEAAAGQPEPATAAAAPAAGLHVAVTTRAASWVSIISTAGKRLQYGTLPAGSDTSFSSSEPLRVSVGNASATEVSINGAPVAIGSYQHGNVARFRVALEDGEVRVTAAP